MGRARRTRKKPPGGRYTPPRPRQTLEAVEGVTLDGRPFVVVSWWCDDPSCDGGCR